MKDWYAEGAADARHERCWGPTSAMARERAERRRDRGDQENADYWTGYAVERARMEVEARAE